MYVLGGHSKVRPSMTEQEYFFILSLYSSSTYYMVWNHFIPIIYFAYTFL